MLGDDLQTVSRLDPIGLAALAVVGLAVLLSKRQLAAVCLLVMVMLIPSGQRLILGPFDFTLLRLLILIGWIRIVLKNELTEFETQPLDLAVFGWAVISTLMYTAQQESVSALINRLGVSFDALGAYFFIRVAIRGPDEVTKFLHNTCILAVILSGFFLYEMSTGTNPFGYLGGVPSTTESWGGAPRQQGPFSHPILAGVFSAGLLPYSFYHIALGKRAALTGLVSACALVFIIFAARSSTSFIGMAMAIVGMLLFRYRSHMRVLRWFIVVSLIGLHVVMQAPVWHLISRIDLRGGSTGYHRYRLIDQAIENFDEWWLLGASKIDHWGIWANDITNQYILEGLRGGVLTLAVFVLILLFAYRTVGTHLVSLQGDRRPALLVWSLGVSVAVHMGSFLAVSYFGQATFGWYLSLGLVASLAHHGANRSTVNSEEARTSHSNVDLLPESRPLTEDDT